MEIAVDPGGLDALARSLQADTRPAVITGAMRRFADAFVLAARAFSPFRSGRLERSISAEVSSDGVLIRAAEPYAVYVLAGVRPGYMAGLVGHTVAFTARDGTRVVRKVSRTGEYNGRRHWYHPGTPANDFFRRAWEDPVTQSYRAELAAQGVTLTIAFLYETRYAG